MSLKFDRKYLGNLAQTLFYDCAMDKLVSFQQSGDDLYNIGFFEAPASTKYHGNYEGGLFGHSIMVTQELVNLTKKLDLKWERPQSPYIVGLLHDLCKVDNYTKKEDGSYDYNKDKIFTGHGSLSVVRASEMFKLTEEEKACIFHHMGAYEKDMWNEYDKAIEKYPNVLYTHTADMIASKIIGV